MRPLDRLQLDQGQARRRDRRDGRRHGRRAGRRLPSSAGRSELRTLVAAVIALAIVQFLARGMTSPLREMAAAATRDGARRLRPPRARRPRATRSASWRARSTRWRPSWPTSTGCGATWWPTSRTSCARRSARCRRCWRTSSTASSRPTRPRCGPRWRRPSASAGSSSSCSTSRGSRAAGCALEPVAVRACARCSSRPPASASSASRHARPAGACRVQPGDLRVTGDAERMHQVVANLLDNAVRHSPADGRVWLERARRDGRRDDDRGGRRGPGDPAATRRSGCSSASTASTRRAPRATAARGLGLAIARWIVDAHGGTIRAEGREPGGCRIVVELPA